MNDVLPAFVCNCLRLYKTSLGYDFKLPSSDRLPGDDAAILAAMALVRMYQLRERFPDWTHSLYRCVALLEFALHKSKHNYDMLLILVRVYLHLGAGSLAIARFSQLSIKNIQYLTVSWMLYTRLSTIHPYPVTFIGLDGHKMTIDPLEATNDILKWYRRAYQLNSQSMESFRGSNQWMMELDALGAKSALQDSFPRLMLLAESSRMRRFRHPKDEIEDKSFQAMHLPKAVKDTRDTAAFPTYEAHGQSRFWEILPPMEVPGTANPNEGWLALNLRQTSTWESLCGKDTGITNDDELTSFMRPFVDQDETSTVAEENLFHICDLVQRGHNQLRSQGKQNRGLADYTGRILLQFNEAIEEAHRCSSSKKENPPGSLVANIIHDLFCSLDACQFVAKFASLAQNRERPEPLVIKLLADLQAGCRKIAAIVLESATDNRTYLGSQSTFDALYKKCSESDQIGRELNHLLANPVSMHKVLKTLQESWIDAFDGVINTKVIN